MSFSLVGEEHKIVRARINQTMVGRAIKAFAPRILEIADAIFEEFALQSDEGKTKTPLESDLIRDFAKILPARVIADFLKLPPDTINDSSAWTDALAGVLGAYPGVFDSVPGGSSPEDAGSSAILTAAQNAMEYLVALTRDHFAGDDVSATARFISILFGAHQTTRHLLGGVFHTLMDRPDLLDTLRKDRNLLEGFIEELLRLRSPIQILPRIALTDLTLGGKSIQTNDLILIFPGAANRDPRRFKEPLEFQPDRGANRHLAFGIGRHFCPGANLARLEVTATLEIFLRRFSGIIPGDPARRQNLPGFCGFDKLPALLTLYDHHSD